MLTNKRIKKMIMDASNIHEFIKFIEIYSITNYYKTNWFITNNKIILSFSTYNNQVVGMYLNIYKTIDNQYKLKEDNVALAYRLAFNDDNIKEIKELLNKPTLLVDYLQKLPTKINTY